MILVDTSVWVDHLRYGDATLEGLLESGRVMAHAFVIGELALGDLRQRDLVLDALLDLPQAVVASEREVLNFIDQRALYRTGVGYVDAHLLAAVQLTAGSLLWTRDKRLLDAADRLGLAANFTQS